MEGKASSEAAMFEIMRLPTSGSVVLMIVASGAADGQIFGFR